MKKSYVILLKSIWPAMVKLTEDNFKQFKINNFITKLKLFICFISFSYLARNCCDKTGVIGGEVARINTMVASIFLSVASILN